MSRIVFFICLALSAGSALAQNATTTSLVGTVADSTGKVVPGASVTAVNIGTHETYSTTTNEQGYYSIQFVRVGSYEVTVMQPGFQTSKETGIQVDINQVVRTDVTLKVGDVKQSITIEATAPAIATDDASISEIIGQRAVAELPLNGRDAIRLAITTPGVIAGMKNPNVTATGEDFIGPGAREIQNSLSLDGISIVSNLITNTSIRPNADAIQEFQVQTGTYSAEYGSYMGVHINLVTKSGTNSLHGAVFEFLRNDKLDARGFFEKPGTPRNPLRQNQFGFEVDGPVLIPHLYNGKNKTFFMGSYEGFRNVQSTTALDNVMTPLMRQGNFSELLSLPKPVIVTDPFTKQPLPNNIIPQSQISPIAQKLLQYYPLPDLQGLSANNYSGILGNNAIINQTLERIDQNIGDKVRLYFRYDWQNTSALTGATNVLNSNTNTYRNRNFAVGYTHTFTPRIVNDFRIGRERFDTAALNYFYSSGQKDIGTSLGIPGFTGDTLYNNPGTPDFNMTGFMTLSSASTNWFQNDTTNQLSDVISYNIGSHNIRAGLEFRRLATGRAAVNSARGIFTFSGTISGYSPADFMFGLPLQVSTPGPEIRGRVAEWRDGFFVTDNWQVSRKLTMNIGLRYELPTVPYTINGTADELNREQTALVPSNPPVPGYKFIDPNHKDFAPRLGLAYRLTEKTVLRAGYGIYYNPNQTNTFTFLNTNPPFSPIVQYNSPIAAPTLSFANPIPSTGSTAAPNCFAPTVANPCTASIVTPNVHLPSAYMNQWSFDVERELWRGAGLDVQYLGSHSLHLDRSYYNNTPLPGPGAINPRRPNQLFTVIRTINNDEIQNYDGLNVVLRQRMSHGLQGLFSYSWSHTLDVTTDSNGGGAPMNPYNWREDYGNANWDLRHRFVASWVYELPFLKDSRQAVVKWALANWQVNGITTLQSGFPFNVTVAGDPANTSAPVADRPNLISPATANCGGGHLTNCISAASFTQPAQYTYGTAGRNILRGPGLIGTDFSVFKNFPIRESVKFQFRAEFFNMFNTPHFNNPGVNNSGATFGTAAFGSISSTASDNRQIQFGAKILF
jgi:Carboxypeptidase regulatory-like domain/TonB dependent receptor